MGEATYYMKARLQNEQTAIEAMPKLKAFIDEGLKAADWWQAHRHETPAAFFKSFKKQFPQVHEFLYKYTPVDFTDCNNRLAGLLDFGDEETDPVLHGTIIEFSGLVWHFADWDPFTEWLKDTLGAVNAAYISDEYANIADCIEV